MRWLAGFLMLLATAGASQAQMMVADLSQSRVSIDTNFAGSNILVFGAVRESGQGAGEPFDIIVTVSGPRQPATVRKKARVAGIWVNTEAATVAAAPTFYNISSTRNLDQILSETADLHFSITVDRAISAINEADIVTAGTDFSDALIRIREGDGTYTADPRGVKLIGNTLFRAGIELPSNVVEGNYLARIFMTRDKQVIATFTDVLFVQKVGLERWIFALAQEQAAIYGLMSLAIAIVAGWAASAVFRYVRGN